MFRHCAYDDSESHGDENAAGKSLTRAEENHLTQARRNSAQRAEHQKKKHVRDEVVTNSKHLRKPGSERDRDDFAKQVSSRNQGAFVGGTTDPVGDITR